MHIQYLLNLGPKNYSYVGSGQQKLSGSAQAFPNIRPVISNVKINLSGTANFVLVTNLTVTALKFQPYDIGFDSNANQWRILEIFGVNGNFVYKACNGINSKYFNENELFTQSQIVEFYNNKIDQEINCLFSKYEDILNS
jgi:hypothetical protein